MHRFPDFPNLPRTLGTLAIVLGFLAVPACGPDATVATYKVPKTTAPAATPAPGDTAEPGEFRFLGAMFPADDPTWFVKFAGPAEPVGEQSAKFDEFLQSFDFGGGEPKWKLPSGWSEGPTRNAMGIVIRTLRVAADSPLEVTISSARGGVQSNVDRWAEQVGAPNGPQYLDKYTKPVTAADGTKGFRVDVTGPKNPASTRPPFMGGGR